MRNFLEGPLLITFLIKELNKKFPEKQVGKTIIQKLMYLFSKKAGKDFSYTLYYYGPYSSTIGEYINMAEAFNFINVKWHPDQGYEIEYRPDQKEDELESKYLKENEIHMIEKIVDAFGNFTANELSIITTAMYVRDNFGVEKVDEIIDIILSLKPQNTREWVKDILVKGGIIGFSN